VLALLLLVQAVPAVPAVPPAQDPSRARPPATMLVEPAAMFLAACDANGDARVTAAERDACVVRAFVTADGAQKGSTGYIGYADWAQRWLGDRNALPSPFEMDRDGDNRITLAEMQARFAAVFDRLDADHDGLLQRAELIGFRSAAQGGPEGAPGEGRGKRRGRR